MKKDNLLKSGQKKRKQRTIFEKNIQEELTMSLNKLSNEIHQGYQIIAEKKIQILNK